MGEFLRAELAAGHRYLPAGPNVLRAFTFPFDRVRVLIVGQDPYPTPGHAVGLSFSVAADVRPLPRSLANIFTEYARRPGLPRAGQRRPDAVGAAWGDAAEQGAHRAAGHPGVTSRQGLGGRHRMRDPGAGGPAAAAGGGAVGPRRRHAEADAGGTTARRSNRPIPRRCRRRGGSSARGRSAAPTSCWRSWAPSRRLAPALSVVGESTLWIRAVRPMQAERYQPRETLPALRQDVHTLTRCLLPPGRPPRARSGCSDSTDGWSGDGSATPTCRSRGPSRRYRTRQPYVELLGSVLGGLGSFAGGRQRVTRQPDQDTGQEKYRQNAIHSRQ